MGYCFQNELEASEVKIAHAFQQHDKITAPHEALAW